MYCEKKIGLKSIVNHIKLIKKTDILYADIEAFHSTYVVIDFSIWIWLLSVLSNTGTVNAQQEQCYDLSLTVM